MEREKEKQQQQRTLKWSDNHDVDSVVVSS